MLKTFAHFDFRMAKLQIINHKQRHLKNFGIRLAEGVKLVPKGLSDGFPTGFPTGSNHGICKSCVHLFSLWESDQF